MAGKTWSFMTRGIGETVAWRASFHPTDPNRIWFPLADLGATTVSDAGASGVSSGYIAPHFPYPDDIVMFSHRLLVSAGKVIAPGGEQSGHQARIYQTTNNGVTWTKLAGDGLADGRYDRELLEAVASSDNPDDFLVFTAGTIGGSAGGAYRTTNGGASFTRSTGLPNGYDAGAEFFWNVSLERDASDLAVRYLLLRNSGFWKSTNRGASWTFGGAARGRVWPLARGCRHGTHLDRARVRARIQRQRRCFLDDAERLHEHQRTRRARRPARGDRTHARRYLRPHLLLREQWRRRGMRSRAPAIALRKRSRSRSIRGGPARCGFARAAARSRASRRERRSKSGAPRFSAARSPPATPRHWPTPKDDGISNAAEYVFAKHPLQPDGARPWQAIRAGDRLALTFPRNLAATDATITIQAADNLAGPWENLARSTAGLPTAALLGGVLAVETGSGATRAVEVRDLFPIDAAHPQRFMRLEIVLP